MQTARPKAGPAARPLGRLATLTAALLAVSTAALAAALGVALLPLVRYRIAAMGGPPIIDDPETDGLARLAASAALGSLALSGVAFLAWLRRVAGDRRAGDRGGLTPVAAVGWWFVPIVNLVRPYAIVREVHDGLAVPGRRAAPIGAWWFCWVVAVVPAVTGLAAGWLAGFYLAVGVLPLVAGFVGVSRLWSRAPLAVRLALALPGALVVLAAMAVLVVLVLAVATVSSAPDGPTVIDGGIIELVGLAIVGSICALAVAGGILAIRVVVEIDRRAAIVAAAVAPQAAPA